MLMLELVLALALDQPAIDHGQEHDYEHEFPPTRSGRAFRGAALARA
jgi:hypothetical protein